MTQDLIVVVVRFHSRGVVLRRGLGMRHLLNEQSYGRDQARDGDDGKAGRETQLAPGQFRHEERAGDTAKPPHAKHPRDAGGSPLRRTRQPPFRFSPLAAELIHAAAA
jgi:hypothetical protein